MHTYYDILGITPQAPQEIVRAVYRAWMQALKIHPDLGGDEDFAKKINLAYETLGDPERRVAYDAKIKIETETGEARRRAPRTVISARIAFCIPPDGKWLAAETHDASTMGLRLLTTDELITGLNVSIAFPESAVPAVEACVRWTRPLKTGGAWTYESGVEFFNPVPDILRRLGA